MRNADQIVGRGPGPTPLELFRSLAGLREDPLRFLDQAVERYGELVHYRLGPLNAFLLSRAEDIQRVLLDNQRNYTRDTFQYNALAEVTGRGLLTNDGEDWLRQRRRIQPAFHRQRIAGFGELMADAAARTADTWQRAAENGEMVDVDREMMKLTLEILGKALMGVDLSREAPALTGAVLTALDHTVGKLKSPSPLPGWLPTPSNRRFRAAMRRLDGAVEEIIQAHRQATRSTEGAGGDLLDALLGMGGGETPLTDRQVRDELITILIAGHETVASALTWTFYLLAQNPGAAERLDEELGRVLDGRRPGAEDLPALDYTRRVFDEALRLYPPAWLVTRKSVGEDVLGGVRVPPGSLVIVSIWSTQRSAACWPDPLRFDPDRFLPAAAGSRPRFAYLPFGGGPRLCIGNTFALTEGPLVLATIWQRCRLELVPGQAVIVDPLVTLRPRGGLPLRAEANQVKFSARA